MDTLTAPSPTLSTRPSRPDLTGLVIEQRDGLSCPFSYCDHCGQQITNAALAGILWTYPRRKNGRTRFRLLCKFLPDGRLGCLSDPAYRLQPWMELQGYLMSLLFNLGIKTKAQVVKAWEHADVVARFE